MGPLILQGEVDPANAQEVLVDLFRQLDERNLIVDEAVEIDCSGLTYLGSHGVRMLVQFRAGSHRDVVLVGLPKHLRRLFEMSGLGQLFELRERPPI